MKVAQAATVTAVLASCVSAPHQPLEAPLWPYGFNGRAKRTLTSQLARVEAAADRLHDGRLSAAGRAEASHRYNTALSELIRDWSRRQLPKHWQDDTLFGNGNHQYVVAIEPPPGDTREVSPVVLDRLMLADQVHTPRRAPQAKQPGLGVAVIGHMLRPPAHAASQAAGDAVTPPNGAYLALTAVMKFDPKPAAGEPRRCRLHLYNPLQVSEVTIDSRPEPLAANYTAAKHLALNDRLLDSYSVPGLLYPAKTLDATQLYCLDPYDPNRIPVVFVHGLLSDPHVWFNIVNAIYADPELRSRYQPWYFLYPTGLAIPNTASLLRESLRSVRKRFDPDFNDPGMNRMVLVGHSMGGLLNRMQTIDSRDDFWRAYFNCKPEDLKVADTRRGQLISSLKFSRQPYVKRLIFIAVPHRGSEMAQYGLIHRLSRIIRLPIDSVMLTKDLISGNGEVLSPQIREWGPVSFLGLGTLSPKHPYLQALNAQPIPVPHHSIIARSGLFSFGRGGDGAVRYESSHLDTGTELIVRGWHNCAKKPEVVAEVLARLRQHLRESR